MPVEAIDLVAGEHVDVPLHELGSKEVTADIEVHAPVRETRRVTYLCGAELERPTMARDSIRHARRQQLAQRLKSIEEPGVVSARHRDVALSYYERVPLRTGGSIEAQADLPRCSEGQRQPGGELDGTHPKVGDPQ